MIVARTSLAVAFVASLSLLACSDDAADSPDTTADVGEDLDSANIVDPVPDARVERDTLNDAADDGGDILSDADGGGGVDAGDGSGDTGVAIPGDGSVRRPPVEEQVTTCRTLTAPATGVCQVVQTGTAATLLRGIVLTPEGRLDGGEVLVDAAGMIACVGCDCSDAPDYASAAIVECAEGVITPGLINAHDHITYTQNAPGPASDERYDHRHDWRRGIREHTEIDPPGRASNDAIAWGELRQFMTGTTTMTGSGTGPGIVRNLDRGGDAQLGLGQPTTYNQVFPLDDGGGQLRTDDCSYGAEPDGVSVLGNECYLPHVSEGIDPPARNEFLCLSSSDRGGLDLVEPNTAMIHAIGLTAIDGLTIAQNSAKVIWSPRSNVSLYGNTAPVTMYLNQGVRIGMGTDWTPSGSVTMTREMACAAYLNETHFDDFFTPREIWLMATAWNAEALSIDDVVGRLQQGLVADIAIFALDGATDPYTAIINADSGTTQMVMRGGQIRYGAAEFRGTSIRGGGGADVCDAISVCGEPRFVCIQDEIGKGFAALQTANSSFYILTYCDEIPPGEPTCEPFRPDEYDGVVDGDQDGDGVLDDDDNCPTLFNAIRPVDGDVQSDVDNDGVGDACDVCPTQGATIACGPIDPDDVDGDGFVNAEDNCPYVENADQADGDSDFIGDLCDPCPEAANPGGAACPATIYDIKQLDVPLSSRVEVTGVVTALQGRRFFIQVPAADYDVTLGSQFSGVFVFMPGTAIEGVPAPAIGDLVTVTARTQRFSGQIQLSSVEAIVILDSDQTLDVTLVDPAAVATDGALADAYEGVLVTVDGVEVLSLTPTPVDSDPAPRNEYTVTGNLRVDDTIFNSYPSVFVGDPLTITGVIQYSYNHNRLLPRSVEDVIVDPNAPPTLISLTPASIVVPEDVDDSGSDIVVTVGLNRPAPEDGVTVRLTSSNSAFTPSDVFIAAGATSGDVSWTSSILGSDPLRDGELNATLDDTTLTVPVRVYSTAIEAELISVEAASAVNFAGDVTFVLTFAYPTVDPQVVQVASSNPAVFDDAQTINVFSGTVRLETTLEALAPGTSTLTFEVGDASIEVLVAISEGSAAPCLIFSEYVEGTSNNKAIEIYNCGTGAIELDGIHIDIQANERVGSSTNTQALSGVLNAGGTYAYSTTGSVAALKDRCNATSAVANFNGNDRLVLYQETNGTARFQLGEDTVLDMFGNWNTEPSGEIWVNNTWRRCVNTDPFLGDTPFEITDYYSTFGVDTFTDVGQVTAASCP
jgi:cytosine/adenosine deaminase-related metal-dependent hydrolase